MEATQGCFTISSEGIYHGLPSFPPEKKGLTALVTGANGISGTHMLRILCKDPNRWEKVYALSRRPPYMDLPAQVEHMSVDLLQDSQKIAQQLKEKKIAKVDYVFFFAYIQPTPKDGGSIWSAAEELVKVNKALLQNFLEGLEVASLIPERILLQLGAKYYGIHLGPTALPHVESNPRVTLQPNFYYDQEDVLMAFCEKHGCGWNTTRPSWIPGVAPDAAMNLAYPLIIYACVQKHLGRNLVFPGDLVCWENPTALSSAMTNAYFSEWAVLTEGAKNESFNAMDDSVFTWSGFWPKYAAYFGLASEGPETAAESDYREQVVATPPLPRGWGPPVVNRFRFTLTEWAKDPQVAKAWAEIAEAANLSKKDLGDVDRIFGFADAALLAPWPILYSNEKRRKLGYFGYVDSTESMFQVFKEFVDLGMAPPV